MRPYLLAAIGATLDLVVAVMLVVLGMTVFGAFMGVVAVVGYVLAVVLCGGAPADRLERERSSAMRTAGVAGCAAGPEVAVRPRGPGAAPPS